MIAAYSRGLPVEALAIWHRTTSDEDPGAVLAELTRDPASHALCRSGDDRDLPV